MEYYTELPQGLRASGRQGRVALIATGENHGTCKKPLLRAPAHCPLPASAKDEGVQGWRELGFLADNCWSSLGFMASALPSQVMDAQENL